MREELEIFLAADPFAPFQVTMMSGQSYLIREPGLAMVAGDIMYLMRVDSDTHSVLRLVQIASIDTIT